MNKSEQAAFVAAYCDNVGSAFEEYVFDFVTRLESGEDMPYCVYYKSIVDALGMWHSAIRFNLEALKNENK